jgi:FAD/FMN-containing dehydrogenase
MNVRLSTSDGSLAELPAGALDQLESDLPGRVHVPTSAEFTESCTIWNAMIEKRPGLVVRCSSTADVSRAVKFAREHDLMLSVRGGGHNIAGSALCDGGIMLDLSPMKSVTVDKATRTARVGGGATLADVDQATQAAGLAVPLGVNSTTGIGGLTLGGGWGWLSRSLGLTVDSLLSAEVVLANGDLVRASATESPDLFWAIRGGGGNFGVVTSFEFRLHNVGPEVLSGLVIHPLDAARDVLHYWRDFLKTTPEEFVCWFVMRKAPPLPFLPAEWHGKEILVLAMCYSGPDLKEGERIAEPLRKFGKPIADVVGPNPYAGWQTALDPLLTPGFRNYWKSHDFGEVSDGLIDALIAHARKIPDPNTEIAFAQLGGAVTRVAPEATAYSHRDGQFVMNVHGRWQDLGKDQECIGWARDLFQATAPFSTGSVYVNFLTQDEEDRIKAAYGRNYERLARIKAKYDPTNLFRANMNIRPLAYA